MKFCFRIVIIIYFDANRITLRLYIVAINDIILNAYNLITDYRADDSYFDFVEAFLNNAITVEQLSRVICHAAGAFPYS